MKNAYLNCVFTFKLYLRPIQNIYIYIYILLINRKKKQKIENHNKGGESLYISFKL